MSDYKSKYLEMKLKYINTKQLLGKKKKKKIFIGIT